MEELPPDQHFPLGWDDSRPYDTQINAFKVRFRIANAYEGLTLKEGINANTASCYSELIRLVLTYSAYEVFQDAFGLKADDKRDEIEEKYNKQAIIDQLFRSRWGNHSDKERYEPLFSFIKKKSISPRLAENAANIFYQDKGSLVLLAESIRHVFIHAELAPASWGGDAFLTARLCNVLSGFLLEVMYKDASPRMIKKTEAMMQKKPTWP